MGCDTGCPDDLGLQARVLEEDGRDGARLLFERFDHILTDGRLIGREGSMVDPNFLEEPRQRNSGKENEQNQGGEKTGRI